MRSTLAHAPRKYLNKTLCKRPVNGLDSIGEKSRDNDRATIKNALELKFGRRKRCGQCAVSK